MSSNFYSLRQRARGHSLPNSYAVDKADISSTDVVVNAKLRVGHPNQCDCLDVLAFVFGLLGQDCNPDSNPCQGPTLSPHLIIVVVVFQSSKQVGSCDAISGRIHFPFLPDLASYSLKISPTSPPFLQPPAQSRSNSELRYK
jgi:hypothetical protein